MLIPGGLYTGRLLLGFANGFYVTFSNIYTTEAAPTHLRGVVVALFAWWVNVGSLIGPIVTWRTSSILSKRAYEIPLGCLIIVPVLLEIFMLFVPESPRWLTIHDRHDEARKSLAKLV